MFGITVTATAKHKQNQWWKNVECHLKASEIINCTHTDTCINFNLTQPQGQQPTDKAKKKKTVIQCVNKTSAHDKFIGKLNDYS